MFVPKLSRIFILALIVCATFVVPAALAQQGATPRVEFVGTIESLNATTMVVNGQPILITGAQVATGLQVGTPVRVEGALVNGTVQAREVRALQGGLQPGESEFVGVLTAISGSSLMIGGQAIDASRAEIEAGLAVGSVVRVHATFVNGVWVAREVERFTGDDDDNGNDNDDNGNDNGNDNDDNGNDNDDNGNDNSDDSRSFDSRARLTGTLTAVGEGFIVVAGQLIDTSRAEVNDPLLLGALVEVDFTLQDGQWIAREVEFEDGDDRDDDGGDNDNDDDDDNGNFNDNDDDDDNGNFNTNSNDNDDSGNFNDNDDDDDSNDNGDDGSKDNGGDDDDSGRGGDDDDDDRSGRGGGGDDDDDDGGDDD
jgi:hypothetical protein